MKRTLAIAAPLIILIAALGVFAGTAWMMSRTNNAPLANMPVSDPARPGASLRAQTPEMAWEDAALPAQAPPAYEAAATPGQRIPVPMFWMALGGMCAAAGILAATHGTRRAR